MECEKIRERLITEYGDEELSAEENAEVQRHLTACPECRGFFEAVQKSAVAPFKGAGEMQPESVVWQRIRERIEAEKARSQDWRWKPVAALVSVMRTPRPVFRLAFVMVLIVAGAVLAKWPATYADPVYSYISEQMIFMSGLKAGDTDLLNGDLRDYDVAFEAMNGSNSPFKE